ncbi:hypothetical protein POM88_005670 [Heracleum sosnowskyi]|uniref:Uncharacterized protein n=1 Tax=Heracleum sosnowskyi TaxID=360622 RepID=A0AAD8N4I6_9APIA|nr:hypothetical protein POM88_005670 [Heracleum sosnowskyi]
MSLAENNSLQLRRKVLLLRTVHYSYPGLFLMSKDWTINFKAATPTVASGSLVWIEKNSKNMVRSPIVISPAIDMWIKSDLPFDHTAILLHDAWTKLLYFDSFIS